MAVSLSRPDPTSPSSVAEAGFSTARRGFNPDEVRAFLVSVSTEMRRLDEQNRQLLAELTAAQARARRPVQIDDSMVAEYLGEETTRVLQTARDSASSIKIRAEERANELLRDASTNAAELRRRAEVEAAQRRQEAESESQAIVAEAKAEGRAMVSEARGYRERVLADLERRTNLARQQLEELEHARQRLLQVFERARLVAIDVSTELEANRPPHEVVDLSPVTGPVPVIVPASSRPLPTRPGPAGRGGDTIEQGVVGKGDEGGDSAGTAPTRESVKSPGVTVTTGATRPRSRPTASTETGTGPTAGSNTDTARPDPAPDRRNVVDLFPDAPSAAAKTGDGAAQSRAADAEETEGRDGEAVAAESDAAKFQDAKRQNAKSQDPKSQDVGDAETDNEPNAEPDAQDKDAPAPETPRSVAASDGDARQGARSTQDTNDATADNPGKADDSPGSADRDPTESGSANTADDAVDGLFERLRQGLESSADEPAVVGADRPVDDDSQSAAAPVKVAGEDGPKARSKKAAKTKTAPAADGGNEVADAVIEETVIDVTVAEGTAHETVVDVTVSAATVTDVDVATGTDDSADGPETDASLAGSAPFADRDAAIEPIISAVARAIKRRFGDEQNAALHLLGGDTPVEQVEDLISDAPEQMSDYQGAIADLLVDAGIAGVIARGGTDTAAMRSKLGAASNVEAINEILNESIVGVLRDRIEVVVRDGNGDNKAISKRLRSIYRELKTENVDDAAGDLVRAAYGAGMAIAARAGTPQVWLVDQRFPACPDCEDNSLSPPVSAGDEFPTGVTAAPAHPGCRCLVVPATEQ